MSEQPEALTFDKSEWGVGPWQSEPDRVEWEHAGLPCLAIRTNVGYWCGYAAVPPGHPLHGVHYDKAPTDVHGGLTYSGFCSGHICHVPKPGAPDNVFWFGFACAHFNDFSPGRGRELDLNIPVYQTYRTLAYVQEQTDALADQLAALGSIAV